MEKQALDFLLKRGPYTGTPTPQLIFLDVHLPNWTASRYCESSPRRTNFPFACLTSSEKERRIFREEFGIEDSNYLIKPVNPQNLRGCPRIRGYI